MKVCLCVLIALMLLGFQRCHSQVKVEGKPTTERPEEIDGKIKTVYNILGRAVNQSQQAKGWHRVSDLVKLTNGQATITLNTSIVKGAFDVTFLDFKSYHGQAHSSDTSKTYRVIPLTGKQFMIKSSDAADTSTVYFTVEGE